MQTANSSRNWLDTAATLAMLAASGAILVSIARGQAGGGPQVSAAAAPLPTERISLADSPILGSPTARVVMLEFSDFQCPYCSAYAAQLFPEIRRKYVDSGRIQYAFKHLPLKIHPRAEAAATAAECTKAGGHFWQMHDALFRAPSEFDDASLTKMAVASGETESAFNTCLALGVPAHVKADLALAGRLGFTGTPTFLVGTLDSDNFMLPTGIVRGLKSSDDFVAAIDAALSGQAKAGS